MLPMDVPWIDIVWAVICIVVYAVLIALILRLFRFSK